MIHRKAKIKRATKKDSAKVNKDKAELTGANMTGNGNAAIDAQGIIVAGKATTLDAKITASKNAHDDAKAATVTMHTESNKTVDAYNAAATIVEQQLPDNTSAWIDLGFEVTEEEIGPTQVCEKITGGSGTQSDFDGKADIHFDPNKNADYYKIIETKDDPADMTKYYPANPPTLDKSTGTVEPKFLNVPIYWKVCGHNSAGDGPWSDAFGTTIH